MTVNNFSLEQIAQHNTLEDAWVIIHGKVYDVTTYLDDHPGGRNVLTEVAGTDATDDFDYVDHSDDALRKMETFQVGILSGWTKVSAVDTETHLCRIAAGQRETNSVEANTTRSHIHLGTGIRVWLDTTRI
ncbi:hypothetical protein N7471_001076 [Penicillium samsonianum]|uniref:uncharacterized protein n=1 Tax=Penicillium samsonianum TaxID=1882272 RepID=UPI002547F013|nr:uncharacterized protein N7471_001076 [Penicillium samsonianum]KAJ6149877.1 hypothetical protein N7471_001076 [Penicillium samsonianum]